MILKYLTCFFTLVVFQAGLFGQSSKRPFSGWAILQGPTTQTETVFAVLHENTDVLAACVGIGSNACTFTPTETIEKTFPSSSWSVKHFFFKISNSSSNLFLKVTNENGQVDQREFNLHKEGKAFRFAIASCMDDALTDIQETMWRGLLDKKPDVLFLIGDNVYGDTHLRAGESPSPNALWRRYVETWTTLYLYRAPKLVPIYAVWDDHDFGSNDSDSTLRFRDDSRNIFFSFFPQRESASLHLGPGVSSFVTLNGQDFIFLDGRYFRTKNTHWGEQQEDWLFKNLKSNKNPAWLLEGDQFFGGYHKFESYEGNQPASFKKTLSRLKEVKKPFNFISGDRHLSEVMKIDKKEIGQVAYEITSSAIHARTRPGAWDIKKNPRQVAGASGEYNYTIVDSTWEKSKLKVELSAYGLGKKLYDYSFTK